MRKKCIKLMVSSSINLHLYGFGSFFKNLPCYSDIDLLIVHESLSSPSRKASVALKNHILKNFSKCDVSILSKNEELETKFIEKAKASLICSIINFKLYSDFDHVLIALNSVGVEVDHNVCA